MKSNILSHFHEVGISLISYARVDEDQKLRVLFNYLANRSILITDQFNNRGLTTPNKYVVSEINPDILDTLNKLNDKSVFISVPTGEWIMPHDDNALMGRIKYMNKLIRNMLTVAYDKNLSITIISYTYNSVNTTTMPKTHVNPQSAVMSANFWVNYQDSTLNILKNRFGADGKAYKIDDMKELFYREYREKKLKRILKKI